MFESGKTPNLLNDMKSFPIDIMLVSELLWTILNNKTTKYVTKFTPISDRIILVQLKSRPIETSIIPVYVPTTNRTEFVI